MLHIFHFFLYILMNYINEIDILIDKLLNNFNYYINNNNLLNIFTSDVNFIKYQNDILNNIKKFIDNISKEDILNIIKNDKYYELILNIIKNYCCYYIYLGIAYYYKGTRDLYIANLIESSRHQYEKEYQIPNFFTTISNSNLILFYSIIKNMISLSSLKNIEKVKIECLNNITKYESITEFLNEFDEQYIQDYFLIDNNIHNIIKSIIIKILYIKTDKTNLLSIITDDEKQNAEYKYIQVVFSSESKMIDYNIIQKFLEMNKINKISSTEIYDYIRTYNIYDKEETLINKLFNTNVFIPITEEFIRYHKDTEIYDTNILSEIENIEGRTATKIKYIISKINNIKNYYSSNGDKTKLDQLYYKPLLAKKAVLFNDNEEIKIIQKLSQYEKAQDYKLLVDLQNIRKYAFVNYKNLSKDGMKIRPNNTIQCIRSSTFENKKNESINTRVTNSMIDSNMIGICFNPSKIPLEFIKNNQLIDIKTLYKSGKNQYKIFSKLLNDKLEKPDNKLYYWLFDLSIDKPIINTFEEYTEGKTQKDICNNIMIMLKYLYNQYIDIIKNNQTKNLLNNNSISFNDICSLLPLNKNLWYMKDIIIDILLNKLDYELQYTLQFDNIEESTKEIIKLPYVEIKESLIEDIILKEQIIEENIEAHKNISICKHYIDWAEIKKIAKNSEEFNQAIFDFINHYMKSSEHDQYICKSCGEVLEVQKFTFESTYIEELDTYFLTTSSFVNLNLEDIAKYSKFTRIIRNIDKIIERIGYFSDMIQFVGSTPVVKLKRKSIIKDTIDLILLHTNWLKKQPKDRSNLYNKKYGINKELSNLFFFDLKDDIFLTSSTDTDHYKIIKYNNIITYIIFLLILELNIGQILGFRIDNKYNLQIFNTIKGSVFNEFYIRINQQDKTPLIEYPLLCYIIFYISGIIISKKIWLYDDTLIEPTNKASYHINIQKSIIHTIVDLINTIIESDLESESSNFLYKIINSRIIVKLNTLYKDQNLYNKVQEKFDKSVGYNNSGKLIIYKKSPIYIDLKEEFIMKIRDFTRCEFYINHLNVKNYEISKDILSELSICNNGQFHSWKLKNNELECSICGANYNNILKNKNITKYSKNSDYIKKVKLYNLNELSKKYCSTGTLHKLDKSDICSICNVNINSKKSDEELFNLEKNLEKQVNVKFTNNLNTLNKYYNDIKEKDTYKNTILSNVIKKFTNNTKGDIRSYIKSFINKLEKIIGNKFRIQNKIYYLNERVYEIDHDYLGNPLKKNIKHRFILESDNIMHKINNHSYFNKDILYYKDSYQNTYVYYDLLTYQYLGYSKDITNIIESKNNTYIKILPSLYDAILLLGCENDILDLYHMNRKFEKLSKEEIYNQIIRNRIVNLKHIISKIQTILYSFHHTKTYIENKLDSLYKNIKISNLILKQKDKNKNIFQNYSIILNNIFPTNEIINDYNIISSHYINILDIISLNNNDSIILFYFLYNIEKLLDSNENISNISEIGNMIAIMIYDMFLLYYKSMSDYNIRKFDFLLINYSPYVDEKIRVSEKYQDILTKEIVDEVNVEDAYIEREELDAVDLDDYDVDDDIDDRVDAIGYNSGDE
jgi:hypothetical protein